LDSEIRNPLSISTVVDVIDEPSWAAVGRGSRAVTTGCQSGDSTTLEWRPPAEDHRPAAQSAVRCPDRSRNRRTTQSL